VVLANSGLGARAPDTYRAEPVRLTRWPPSVEPAPRLAIDEVVDPTNAHHHEPARLAAALLGLLERERRRRPGVARTA